MRDVELAGERQDSIRIGGGEVTGCEVNVRLRPLKIEISNVGNVANLTARTQLEKGPSSEGKSVASLESAMMA